MYVLINYSLDSQLLAAHGTLQSALVARSSQQSTLLHQNRLAPYIAVKGGTPTSQSWQYAQVARLDSGNVTP